LLKSILSTSESAPKATLCYIFIQITTLLKLFRSKYQAKFDLIKVIMRYECVAFMSFFRTEHDSLGELKVTLKG